MGTRLHSVLSSLLVLATLLHDISATKFIVKNDAKNHPAGAQFDRRSKFVVINNAKNHPGGVRFDREIGASSAIQMMEIILPFIWRIFEERHDSERKYVPVLNLLISDLPPQFQAYTNGDNINFSASAIANYPPNQAKFWFASTMYHEMTHIYQWSGIRTAPGGLTEGFADYVMVKSHIYNHATYPKPGSGSRWDEGYGITERFLEYCDSVRPRCAVLLNKMMRFTYSVEYFRVLTGKSVDQLWSEYKAKYNQH